VTKPAVRAAPETPGPPAVAQVVDRLLHPPEEAGVILSICRSRVFELMATGTLESVKIGRSRRIPHQALVDYVERLRAKGRCTGPG
jgi:excisionase family DNA binding protein